jgi:hypothetical protein
VIPAAEFFQFFARDLDFELFHRDNYSKLRLLANGVSSVL